MKRHIMPAFYAVFLTLTATLFLTACCNKKEQAESEPIPLAPDYADNSQWYIQDRNAAVDIFYIISTETGDYTTADGHVCHYADTRNDTIRAYMQSEMTGVDDLLCGDLNYFSPYYRQCTLESFVDEALANERMKMPMEDVRRSFDYYLKNLNHGRPFILMGFSQGAAAVVDILKQMPDSVYNRMVAAYVFGWRVTDSDMAGTGHFRPALDSNDLGVTICYNSVRDNSCDIPLISDGNRIAINPVNWRTDATPATLISPISPDTVTATLDTVSKLLIVSGYTPDDYMIPLIGRDGNYHKLEISLYRQVLQRNIALRARTFVQIEN